MSHTIIFVHLGKYLPNYLAESLFQARLFNSCPIYLVGAQSAIIAAQIDSALAIQLIPTESVPILPAHAAFRQSAILDRQFRSGFWTYVIERFFYLQAIAEHFNLENIIHLESDNLLYVDLDNLVPILAKIYPGIAVPFDADDRAVAGLIYFRNCKAISALTFAIANLFLTNPGIQINDMNILGLLGKSFGQEIIDSLPVVPGDDPGLMRSLSYGASARPNFYFRHFDDLRGIFDANAVGQYIDGIDPRNTLGRQTIGFINESAVYWPSKYHYMLIPDQHRRNIPHLCTKYGNRWPIFNLHVHSKNLATFISRPKLCRASIRLAGPIHRVTNYVEIPESEIITSERLQALADISVIDDTSAAFNTSIHNIPEIRLCHLRGPRHHLLVENAAQIRALQNANIIFVYTHLIESFFEHVLPHLTQHFVLLTHSSDHCITENHRLFLDDVRLIHWFAQNVGIRHPKLTAIPVGLANRQWAHGDTHALVETISQQRIKKRDLYLNIDVRTNVAHRQPIFNFLSQQSFVTNSPRRTFRDYLEELAEHRFVASPCGNGFEAHRNWEAIYLNVIPIVQEGIWMEQFADLPILPISKWEDINLNYLASEEARIKSEKRPIDKVLLSYWRNRLHQAVTCRETGWF